jgi:hypothetical protein
MIALSVEHRTALGKEHQMMEDRNTSQILDDRNVLNLLTEAPGEWRSTRWLASVLRLDAPGPMGDDGRSRTLRALRRLEAAGMVEQREVDSNYEWTSTAPECLHCGDATTVYPAPSRCPDPGNHEAYEATR